MARAQTNLDFLIGASIMMLTVVFVFTSMPGIFDVGQDRAGSPEQSQVDRAAEYLVTTYAANGTSNELRFNEPGGINETFTNETRFQRFKERTGLNTSTDRRTAPKVNVTLVKNTTTDVLVETSSGEKMTAGAEYSTDQSAVTVSRLVTLSNTDECDPMCRLTVRVW